MRRIAILWAGMALAAALALAACKGGTAPADAGAPAATAVGGAAPAAPATPAAPTGKGKVACDAPDHDYGTVMQGAEVKHTFVLKNVGDGVLRILNARGG